MQISVVGSETHVCNATFWLPSKARVRLYIGR